MTNTITCKSYRSIPDHQVVAALICAKVNVDPVAGFGTAEAPGFLDCIDVKDDGTATIVSFTDSTRTARKADVKVSFDWTEVVSAVAGR